MHTSEKHDAVLLLISFVILFGAMFSHQYYEHSQIEKLKSQEKVEQIKQLQDLENLMKDKLILPKAPFQPRPIPARFSREIA